MNENILRANRLYDSKVTTLLHDLSQFPEETINRRPAGGGWSAIQTVWHVLLAEELALQYVQKKLGYGGAFEKAGLRVYWRAFWLKAGLLLPIKFKAPAATSGEHLPAYITFGELRERWQKTRSNWTGFLEQLPDNLVDKAVFKHPRVGKIGWIQMLDFFVTHLERHRGQVRRAVNG